MDKATKTAAEAIAVNIWEQAEGDLDRALDLWDDMSADSSLPGSTWAAAEDHIWKLVNR